nr:hypothetical protein [Providencia sp. G1(2023)]
MPKINELKRQELSYRLNSESFKEEVKNKIKWDWIAVVIALLIILTLISRWLMQTLTIEGKGIYISSSPAAHQGQRISLEFDSHTGIETNAMEWLILSLNPTRELLEKILRERYEDAAWIFNSKAMTLTLRLEKWLLIFTTKLTVMNFGNYQNQPRIGF